VSLRDVERAMIVFKYFYEKMSDFQKKAKEKPLVQVHTHEYGYNNSSKYVVCMTLYRLLRAMLL
jgi:uncharacterized Fe-S cluster-containing radical SAM superfamily enzyme